MKAQQLQPQKQNLSVYKSNPEKIISTAKHTLSNIMLLGGLGNRDCVEYLPAVVNEFFPHPVGLRALDLGSGHGVAAMAMAEMGFQVAAFDMYRSSIVIVSKLALKESLNISFGMGGVEHVEKLNQKFELIHDHDCFTCTPNEEQRSQFLAGVKKSLAPQGKFVLKTLAMSPNYKPEDSFESLYMDENYVLYRQTPNSEVPGVVEINGKHWTAQKRIPHTSMIRQELYNAGFQILREELEVPAGNHPATFRLVLTSAWGR